MNVLNGIYFEVSIFGLLVRVEENSYEFEDRYTYMLSVKRDVIGNVHVRDGDILAVSRSIQHILADKHENRCCHRSWNDHRTLDTGVMTYFMVDVESDGPIPGDFSMICFGAVVVEAELKRTFYGRLRPISVDWIPEALAVSGFSREETQRFNDPKEVMIQFANWINQESNGRPIFVSDNNGFDWQFINWYFHHFTGNNPFGFSSMNLGSLYKGAVRDTFKNFKHLRRTKHTHNPVDDATGNAEAMLSVIKDFDLKIKL